LDVRSRYEIREIRLHWHREGVPAAEAAKRAGHARSSVTLDPYSHVLVDDREIDAAGALG
jgi:hypothetical protein